MNGIPVRLRPVVGEAIGTTAFFRNRPLFDTLLEALAAGGQRSIRVLFHANSIGVEAYSFIVRYLCLGLDRGFDLECHATDRQQEFIEIARSATYPAQVLDGVSHEERHYFHQQGDLVKIDEAAFARIRFLPSCDFREFCSDNPYDVVFLLNALVYVSAPDQAVTIDRIAGYNSKWLITTGFHRDTIKVDLTRNGYQPDTRNIREIHASWIDRLRDQPIAQETLPPNIHTDWSLQPFSEIEDYEYKYCALFRKSA